MNLSEELFRFVSQSVYYPLYVARSLVEFFSSPDVRWCNKINFPSNEERGWREINRIRFHLLKKSN